MFKGISTVQSLKLEQRGAKNKHNVRFIFEKKNSKDE